MSAFRQAMGYIFGQEGGFTANPADPGNWTGGAVGQGVCRGTKFGISSASYPDVDIADLTLEQAGQIYRRDYWDRIAGDALPPPLALLVFDAAVNSGVGRAARWLQATVGAEQDGMIGPLTLAAVHAHAGHEPGGAAEIALCAQFLARRIMFMADLPTWRIFGLGWARRLSHLPFQATRMTNATSVAVVPAALPTPAPSPADATP